MTIHALPSYELPQTPVANRVTWRPQANRAALLIHDMQTYFLQKYDMSQAPIPMLIERIAALRDVCHKLGIPVFYTAQPTEQPEKDRALLNDFWGPGLTATEFHTQQAVVPELTPAEQDIMLTKWRYSAFQRSDLREQLRNLGRDQLIITGVYAHIGCMTTALEAFMQDVQPFLAIDGVADFSLEEHHMAIHHVSQRCGVSLTCAEIQDSLQS
ncbi:isochorismatase family protein [Alcaligenes faecalis]|uniref:isochorismatase family protein n=1 Tax=Alcaligenes faecalis TaxID=511 RepID=UPI0018D14B25|nr:isochorismatase family protein [Alcaligenes faecalis]MBH0311375.1 isochorismatase family protein [Alcaligenes faecalis]